MLGPQYKITVGKNFPKIGKRNLGISAVCAVYFEHVLTLMDQRRSGPRYISAT